MISCWTRHGLHCSYRRSRHQLETSPLCRRPSWRRQQRRSQGLCSQSAIAAINQQFCWEHLKGREGEDPIISHGCVLSYVSEQKAFLVIHRVDSCSLHVNQNLLRPAGCWSWLIVFEEDGSSTSNCCLHPLKTFSHDSQYRNIRNIIINKVWSQPSVHPPGYHQGLPRDVAGLVRYEEADGSTHLCRKTKPRGKTIMRIVSAVWQATTFRAEHSQELSLLWLRFQWGLQQTSSWNTEIVNGLIIHGSIVGKSIFLKWMIFPRKKISFLYFVMKNQLKRDLEISERIWISTVV